MGGRSADLGEIERIAATGENTVERVVVGGGDGVEFVVVAARAGEREAEHAAAEGVNAVVEDELRCLEVALETAADGQESERAQIGFLLGGQTVGGDLFEDETVERAVAVEGLDDVVAVGVGERNAALAVGGFFRGVGIARDVEPVAAPALAVFGAGEELVDEGGEGGGGRGGGEGLDAIVGRREAEERDVGAADKRARIGGRMGCELFGGEAGADEAVDGMVGGNRRRREGERRRRREGERGRGGDGGWEGGGGDGLEGPMRAGLRERHGDDLRSGRGGGGGAGIGRAALNPLGKDRDFGGAERFLRRHLEVFVFATDRCDEQAFCRIAGHDDGAGVTAGLPAGLGIEAEAALLFFFTVALVAALDEERADLAFEEGEVGSVRCRRGRRRCEAGGEAEQGGDDERANHRRGTQSEHRACDEGQEKLSGMAQRGVRGAKAKVPTRASRSGQMGPHQEFLWHLRAKRKLARDLQRVEYDSATRNFAARQPTLSAASALLNRGRRRGEFVGSCVDSDPPDVCSSHG